MSAAASGSAPKVIPVDKPIWDRVFTVAPLVVIGSKESAGQYDLAPKHMAMPLGWQNYFCFVCTPAHATYGNIARHHEFTVSYPRPDQIVLSSLAAAPRCEEGKKHSLKALPTFAATRVDGVLVTGCYLFLECTRERIVDGFGANSLIIGKVVAAAAQESALRREEADENEQLFADPLMAYLNPGRFAAIRESQAFPFPAGFSK